MPPHAGMAKDAAGNLQGNETLIVPAIIIIATPLRHRPLCCPAKPLALESIYNNAQKAAGALTCAVA
jgi:hypothetical protein